MPVGFHWVELFPIGTAVVIVLIPLVIGFA